MSSKKTFSERDICTKFITPALKKAGWDIETQVLEEVSFTDGKVNLYPPDAPPVFFGHYWLEDPYPVVQAENVVCLDYSIAKGGSLVAYRWDGEQSINKAHFVVVKG